MGSIKFTVVSDSMIPLIPIGSELHLTQEAHSSLRPFDIIVFRRESRLVAHYIWRNQVAYNGTVITRCLKKKFSDEAPVHQNEILGLVKNYKITPASKVWILFLNLISGKF